ncbi:pentatricopeptide repeat-containing protein At2g03880, mitochondrial-like [Andrographis paniculata]|uniref:pentatricopeptide repeat-containing protein At2g03880, mitochondrial-like n=1 Tax=Andrographis paniculata TaxID=175694 RepID=UPI0021E7776C|nr:pentatricopeptide repeat-containing protein At2g03880, mitochondrial-like [Andrographis paniculata]
MGLEFASSQMHKQPQTFNQRVLSTVHGAPRRCSMFFLNKNHRLYSPGFCACLSAGALPITEKCNREFNGQRISEKLQLGCALDEPQNFDTEVKRDRGMGRSGLKWYSEILKDCAEEINLNKGKAIHGHIVRSGAELDTHLWISLINFYAKCGALECSRHVFKQMPSKDVVSWTALISGFVAQGYGVESVKLFCEMTREDVRPNEFTLATVLKGCSASLDLEVGKQLHGEVVKIGVISDAYIGSSLIDLYTRCGELAYADDIFGMMPEKNNVMWNALLNGYAQVGHGEAVVRLFCEMVEPEMRFSNYTLSIVLKGIARCGALRAGQGVHSIVIKIGGYVDDFVSCSLVNMYSKCGVADDALKVFKVVKNPDVVAWSSIISVLDQQGLNKEAAKLFCSMRLSGMRPNQFTLSSLVSAATDICDLRYGQSIHACVYKFGFEFNELVSNALIGMYMKFMSINDGYRIFNKMANRDVVSWNALLSGFHVETSDEGSRIFSQMLVEGLRPNEYTFISTLRSCSSSLNVEFGRQVHSHVIKGKFEDYENVGTALVDMYAKCGRTEDVETIFNRLHERDIFTWTVLISGYSQTDQDEKAARHFNKMRREGVIPNEFTLASCSKAFSGIASLESGRSLHSLAVKLGHSADNFVASSLIDMYSKCGCIESASLLLSGMVSNDTILWNSLICGYSQHGMGEKALQTFREMVNKGVLPDAVTFIGILTSCSHMGLIEEGRKYFYTMSESYGITPSIGHYACLVDLLGRAGNFDEVESLIEQMELTPNALIWENVLGACRLHGNIELGERAANKLFQMEPQTDSNYILLSNLYAQRGRWRDVSKLRASMSSKGIKKEPGCSWVEINAQVHTFLSQDVSHPSLRDIHRKLEELGQKVSAIGYVPNTKYVLQNATDREKIENLFHHSERLALGFALINKNSSGKIRIFKNLRICGDCHEFVKFVSSIVNEEIVIRDASRFHHFRHGMCSCNNYW